MNPSNPVITQAAIITGLITLLKLVVAFGKAFHWFNFDEAQDLVVKDLIETGLPILAVILGAWWASRRTTPLSEPRDVDGTPLTRPDNTPAIPQIQAAHTEALKINDKIDEGQTRGLI